MRFKAWRHLSQAYREAVDGHSPWSPNTVDAQPVLVPDVRLDPALAGLLEPIEREGIRSLAFIPLAIGPRLLGKFMLYHERPHVFTEQEVLVAQTIASHVAFAIDQQEHRESEERYRDLIESVGLAVYTTDANGRITFFNEQAEALWGRAPTLLDDYWCGSWRLFHLDGSPMPHDEGPMAIAIKEDRCVRGEEIVAERPDGSRATLAPYPSPLHDASGEVIGAVNILVDITARRDMEERLRLANSVKDEFLGLVSHEIKTPITTIVGNAEILNRNSSAINDQDRAGALKDILEEGRRLHSIIDNLLVIARLDSGAEVERDLVLIERVAEYAITDRRAKNPARAITLRVDDAPLFVDINRNYFEQVLTNLISNADKYSPRALPIDVVISRQQDFAVVRVIDHGCGIPDGEQEKIFAPFYRSPATAAKASGVGIGLSVCRRLVEAQGGSLWLRTCEDGGAEFGFSLPLSEESGA
jgi:PAS domain S-box-containing protein